MSVGTFADGLFTLPSPSLGSSPTVVVVEMQWSCLAELTQPHKKSKNCHSGTFSIHDDFAMFCLYFFWCFSAYCIWLCVSSLLGFILTGSYSFPFLSSTIFHSNDARSSFEMLAVIFALCWCFASFWNIAILASNLAFLLGNLRMRGFFFFSFLRGGWRVLGPVLDAGFRGLCMHDFCLAVSSGRRVFGIAIFVERIFLC